MNKVLKIGGISILVLFAALGAFSFFSRMFVGSGSSHLSSGPSFGGLNDSIGISDTMSKGSNLMRSEKMAIAPSATSTYDVQSLESQTLDASDKKIIKNGDLSLKVDSAGNSAKKISEIAKANNGEVSSSSFYQNGSNVKSGNMIVRIPIANFEKTFEELKKIATLVIRESTSGMDVTEEYIDLKAQLRNRQAEEQTFVRILDQAQKIDDVLAVTRELARVRGTVEQLEGRIKYLESQTDLSSISISLTEDQNITVADSWRPFQVFKESLNSLVRALQGFADSIVRFVVVIVPFLLIWAIIAWIVYVIGKKIYFK